MDAMNNWLGFSLSSNQDYHPQNSSVSELGFHSDHEQMSTHECFAIDLTPPSIFEAFNTNPPSQDWNVNDDSRINSFSCNQNQETPKLENFLEVGGQSFAVDHHSMIDGGSSHNMGLSMIKNWLRSHATPAPAADDKPVDEAPPEPSRGHTLSLSMSTSSQSSDNKLCGGGGGAVESVPRKSIETFGQRTSIYRGVTRHRWTGRYEAHLWDNSCRREGQTRKGRQGGYDKEEKAARAYDLAALKYWGTTTTTNLPISNYETELEEMKHMTRQEYVASLRRKSTGFSRGASIYRGVTRHHQHGRWQARIGRVAGNKDLYLGTFSTQEEAAEAYDVAAIKFRGLNAVTNFETSRYDVRGIMESIKLPIPMGKRLKEAEKGDMSLQMHQGCNSFGLEQGSMYPYQRMWCKQEQDSDVGFNDEALLQASMLQLNNPNLNAAAAACDGFGFEGVFGSSTDAYRSLYYQSQQLSSMWNAT
ncbi:AP2-like ethylene-responsive transcription factor BBM2 isoform X2 [Salvia miltiorrhiza]|uniref:AP2-like ethylene-responsive transcription factor BBM2 isoform X2 n=1 Tax=Salvia miltiorrhiza TaxID=226208 RepID=UPI0025AD9561|nr:AP2-like ethylene-responsive transcription factor BBM2 isoform X2 [Salvia miltiorrhiza]